LKLYSFFKFFLGPRPEGLDLNFIFWSPDQLSGRARSSILLAIGPGISGP